MGRAGGEAGGTSPQGEAPMHPGKWKLKATLLIMLLRQSTVWDFSNQV